MPRVRGSVLCEDLGASHFAKLAIAVTDDDQNKTTPPTGFCQDEPP